MFPSSQSVLRADSFTLHFTHIFFLSTSLGYAYIHHHHSLAIYTHLHNPRDTLQPLTLHLRLMKIEHLDDILIKSNLRTL
jgi:hypothetical protein